MAIKKFLTFWAILLIELGDVRSQGITLYREVNTREDKLELSLETCTGTLPQHFVQRISCGNFTVECAQFYDSENCTGNSAELGRDSVDKQPWKFENVKSIGPCDPGRFEVCKVNKTNSNDTDSTFLADNKILLFEHADFKGPQVTLNILKECVSLPRKLKNRVSSIQFHVDCIELHESWDCSGSGASVRIRSRLPKAVNLVDWGFDDKTTSVSICGHPCPNSTKTARPQHSSCEHITLYDERNLTGNSKSLSLVTQCIDLNDEWEGATESLRLYKNCLVVYNNFGCSKMNSVSEILHNQNHMAIEHDWTEWHDLRLMKFDGVIRSIGICEEDMPRRSALKAIYMAMGMFISGISLASVFNWIVRKRQRRESMDNIKK